MSSPDTFLSIFQQLSDNIFYLSLLEGVGYQSPIFAGRRGKNGLQILVLGSCPANASRKFSEKSLPKSEDLMASGHFLAFS